MDDKKNITFEEICSLLGFDKENEIDMENIFIIDDVTMLQLLSDEESAKIIKEIEIIESENISEIEKEKRLEIKLDKLEDYIKDKYDVEEVWYGEGVFFS